jgi:radical SAM superfamily enzyme YgiQ (UPF0313 family)
LALRLLKANLGSLEENCEIIEFALRQPLAEKIEPFLTESPKILGISVSIWNHLAAIELLEELEKIWRRFQTRQKPLVVLGGPEVSYLPKEAEIFKHADYVIRGEGETAFRKLCEEILANARSLSQPPTAVKFISAENADVSKIKTAYHLYTDEDVAKKLIYAESSRGCPFKCEFCLSPVEKINAFESSTPSSLCVPCSYNCCASSLASLRDVFSESILREFPLEKFFTEMSVLINCGVKIFKFLDRTFNANIKRAIKIMEFFLGKLEERKRAGQDSFLVHFEMVPSLFTTELLETLSRFPPETLRLETGIQTLNPQAAALINRPSNPEKELETLRLLCEKTNAIIHADLIAGLPGENLASFGKGFDRLLLAFSGAGNRAEIQLGILKLLPGARISRHNESFGMKYNPLPPYEVLETSAMSENDLSRIKNFARFWEIIVNRGLAPGDSYNFDKFMELSDTLLAHFGKNWGIDRDELFKAVKNR